MRDVDDGHWRHYPVVVVTCGPSLTDAQCQTIMERRAANCCRVIVVNNAYRYVTNADVLYAADFLWWRHHHAERAEIDGKPGVARVCPKIIRYAPESACVQAFGCRYIRLEPGRGVADPKLSSVKRGSGSGYQAVGLAVKFGARKVILVGADCKKSAKGMTHNHGDHPKPLRNDHPYKTWSDEFDALHGPLAGIGVDLVNCTIDSAIRTVRRSTLEVELWPHETSSPVATA